MDPRGIAFDRRLGGETESGTLAGRLDLLGAGLTAQDDVYELTCRVFDPQIGQTCAETYVAASEQAGWIVKVFLQAFLTDEASFHLRVLNGPSVKDVDVGLIPVSVIIMPLFRRVSYGSQPGQQADEQGCDDCPCPCRTDPFRSRCVALDWR